jgi:hypothetical protein
MHPFSTLRVAVAAAAVLMLPLAQAAPMSRIDYTASKSRISETYKVAKVACDSLKDNAKDICVEEAKANEKVNRAELEFAYTGKAKDGTQVWAAKADAAYAVANTKDVCRQEAKTIHTKALADAKMGSQVAQARTDAVNTKRDADYKLAAEKCDSMSGDAKSQCLDNAKRTFGKM